MHSWECETPWRWCTGLSSSMCVSECFSSVRRCARETQTSGLAGGMCIGVHEQVPPCCPLAFSVPSTMRGRWFQQGSPRLPSLRRASCWPSPSSERPWRRSDATCGTRKSTPRSTAASQHEVSLLVYWGCLLPPGPGCRVATQWWAIDSQGAEFKAWGQ